MLSLLRVAAILSSIAPAPAFAQTAAQPAENAQPAAADAAAPAPGEAPAGGGSINVELNKLESMDNACRAYFVVENRTPEALGELQLVIYFFDKDGVILRSLALPFNDVRSGQTKVSLFDIPDLGCGDIGRLLVNEILACTNAQGPVEGCADLVATSTRTDATFEY